MAEARRADPDISFNGKSAKKSLEKILEKVEYTDPASGNSDTISIQVYNVDMKFLKGWLPKKRKVRTKSYPAVISCWMR